MLPEELRTRMQVLTLRAQALPPTTENGHKQAQFIIENCAILTRYANNTTSSQHVALANLDYNGIIGTVSTLLRSKNEQPSPELRTLLLDLAEIAANCRPKHD